MKPSHGQAALLAVGLLTRLPIHRWLNTKRSETSQGLAVAYYPVVGAGLGLLLWLATLVLAGAPNAVSAVCLLIIWVALTGALHLDGLADCVDGYFAGHKCTDPDERRTRMLAVMREPASGVMAVVALVLLLLAKWVLLVQLLEGAALTLPVWLALLALPRAALLPYMLSTAYAREQGIAQCLKNQLRLRPVIVSVLITGLLVFGWLPLPLALLSLVLVVVLTLAWRALWQKCIGGFTGDCLGALVELAELTLLVVLSLALF